jgi:hypothetical protein
LGAGAFIRQIHSRKLALTAEIPARAGIGTFDEGGIRENPDLFSRYSAVTSISLTGRVCGTILRHRPSVRRVDITI